MIPLYILGLLKTYGPQHGYSIKKLIAEQLADFTQIKLPTIYYHLEKMAANGLLTAVADKNGIRPEKTVYSITEKGFASFMRNLHKLADFRYQPSFPADGVFFFFQYLENEELVRQLHKYHADLKASIMTLQEHRKESIQHIPDEYRPYAEIIFSHHEHHYQAEADWISESLNRLKKRRHHDK